VLFSAVCTVQSAETTNDDESAAETGDWCSSIDREHHHSTAGQTRCHDDDVNSSKE